MSLNIFLSSGAGFVSFQNIFRVFFCSKFFFSLNHCYFSVFYRFY